MPSARRVVPIELKDRAAADLRFIRETMNNAGSFTALSGIGFVLVGVGAVFAGAIAATMPSAALHMDVWLVDAALSVAIGFAATARKARAAGQTLRTGPFQKFARSFAPAVLAGVAMTAWLAHDHAYQYLPALWLLCYGAALAAGGSFSVAVVPGMGASFMAFGVLCAVAPPAWADALLLAGFGGLHIVFGAVIARRFGG